MNKVLQSEGFEFICEARDCYNKIGNNNYDALNELENESGLFAFATDTDILYIGCTNEVNGNWDIKNRIRQFFRPNYTGNTVVKNFGDEGFSEIIKSSIYALVMEDTKDQKIENRKNSLVEQFKPKFNSKKTKEEKS